MEQSSEENSDFGISRTNALSLLVAFAEHEKHQQSPLVSKGGVVSDVSRVAVEARGLSDEVALGDSVLIDCGHNMARGEIIRVNEDHVLIKPYDETLVPALNASVFANGPLLVSPDKSWKGRVVNALGEAIDDLGPIATGPRKMPVETQAVPALKRARVGKGLRTGVKVIDIFTPRCFGQRIGRLAPAMATTIAEYFCSWGDNVLLMVDSITRYALAAREVAIAAGEPPVSRGFPPSVFSDLPRLLERAGPGPEGKGSITGVYAVLVDGDDHNDPIADAIRGILDGHIVLDRAIAAQGRYPAIDIPGSISRLAPHSWSPEQKKLVRSLKEMISRYEETRDLRAMGAYRPGSDPVLDQAVVLVPRIYDAMNQSPDTPVSREPYDDLAQALKRQPA